MATRRLLQVLAVGGGGGVAAYSLFGGKKNAPPALMPVLSEDVPPRHVQVSALAGSSPASPFDLLVIGGGATGTGIALDAATRGLRTALVEREDFGAGTSSRSTKLVHGGVRYLEKAVFQQDIGQLQLVFHALAERANLLRNAPHLTGPLPTMTPCYAWWELPYYWAGLKAYDLVAGRSILHLSRYCSATQALQLFPTLSSTHQDGRTLKGAVVYYDGQMDDARVNVALATTAARAGAIITNHTNVEQLLVDGGTGLVHGARVVDQLTGRGVEVFAKVVVNAAGPFCDSIRQLSTPAAPPMIQPSSGVHVVLPDYYSSRAMGLIVPKTRDGRVVFMLPWLGRTLAGTTDSSAAITMRPEPKEEEIRFILEAIADYLCVKVRREDVLSAWSGIRPLASDPDATDTASISRDHVVHTGADGMVTITGGKWTTYRCMAEDGVDAAIRTGQLAASPCVTEYLPLTGSEDFTPALSSQLTQQFVRMKNTNHRLVPGSLDSAVAKHLAGAYGGRAELVARIAQNEGLGKRLAHGYPNLEAEVAYCARHEYCESVVDFIARRSRLAFLDTDAASKAIPRVADLLATELHWDRTRKGNEIAEAKAFLETFKSKRNAHFDDGKHRIETLDGRG